MKHLRRAALPALAAATACLAVPAVATATGAPEVGKYEFARDPFVDAETCGFPITVELYTYGTYQLFFDAAGNPTTLVSHFTLVGTDSANGKTLNEISHGTEAIDLKTGAETLRGAGLQKLPMEASLPSSAVFGEPTAQRPAGMTFLSTTRPPTAQRLANSVAFPPALAGGDPRRPPPA